MAVDFGVDSAETVTQALIDSITAAAGAKPAFWGRYLSQYAVTTAEVALLHANGIALLPIWNGVTGSNCAGYGNGQAAATKAIEAAERLGAPYSVEIVCDIEVSFTPDAAFFEGWSDTMAHSPFSGSGVIYCNPYAPTTYVPLEQAMKGNANAAKLGLWSAEPEPGIATAHNLPAWAPATCGGIRPTRWQFYEGTPGDGYGGRVDLDQALSLAGMWLPPQAFGDVDPVAWYYPAVTKAVSAGLMEGVAPTTFDPGSTVTRAQLAQVLARVAAKMGW